MLDDLERFLVFYLGSERFGVPLPRVKEVVGTIEVTAVPFAPPHFKGIMNLRGRVISVIDLRAKLRTPGAGQQHETAVIILDLPELSLGVIVDSIENVEGFKKSEIHPTPDLETTVSKSFITGVCEKDKKLIMLLDIEKALDTQDLRAIKKNNGQMAA